MHGAALAARAAGLAPRQLGQHTQDVVAQDVGPAVRAVRRDDLVVRPHGAVHAHRARFLAGVSGGIQRGASAAATLNSVGIACHRAAPGRSRDGRSLG